jgi:NAD(P)-dependent dehydrogenase (short-subunit alcohol dehydrogenase family)
MLQDLGARVNSSSPMCRAASGERGVAVVTGGRRGIGAAICRELARQGFDIAVTDVVLDPGASEVVEEIRSQGRQADFFALDISKTNDHQSFLKSVLERLGPVSCLVNNAGIQVPVRGDLLDVSESAFDSVINVNLRGTFFLTQAVARQMATRSSAPTQERSIIFITSANAAMASPEKAAYCASKSALSMVSQLFALRLAEHGIRVHEIRPGLIRTDMTAEVFDKYSQQIEQGISAIRRWGEPEDIARCVSALATGAVPFSTGDVFNVGGGLHIERL